MIMFENYELIDWRDSFRNLEKNYLDFDNFRKKMRKLADAGAAEVYLDLFCQNYCALFNQTVDVIKYFLQEKGLFQQDRKEILAEAYYVELIHDGQIWIDAMTLVEKYEQGQITDELKKLIIIYSTDGFFKIFDKIIVKLKEMVD